MIISALISLPLAESTSFWQLVVSSIKASSAIEVGILVLLAVCSVASWGIVFWKLKAIRSARVGNVQMADAFVAVDDVRSLADRSGRMTLAPSVAICNAAFGALAGRTSSRGSFSNKNSIGSVPNRRTEERVQLAMEHANRQEAAKMHRGMDVLASIASSTPFIGLFGTVLGIMHTFQVLGTAKSASLNVVAPGIAAALIATAAGLAVAIPAVFLYNWLTARMDEIQEQSDMFVESLGEAFLSQGVFQHEPKHNQVSHSAGEPIVVGEGAYVPGSRQ